MLNKSNLHINTLVNILRILTAVEETYRMFNGTFGTFPRPQLIFFILYLKFYIVVATEILIFLFQTFLVCELVQM
jgi:hypothetical protein